MVDKQIIKQEYITQEVSDKGDFRVKLVTLGMINSNGYAWSNDVELLSDQVQLSPFNHHLLAEGSFFGGDIIVPNPVGAAKVQRENGYLYIEGKYNIKVQEGKDAYERAKFLKENGFRDPWSIGFYAHEVEEREVEGQYIPFVMVAEPIEASPVMAGADKNAELLTIQSNKQNINKQEPSKKVIWLPGIQEVIYV